MKKYIFTALLGLTGLLGHAYEFTATDANNNTWYLDWVEPGVTCKLADRNDITSEFNPKAQPWESPVNIIYIPTNEVIDNSNSYKFPSENTLGWGNRNIPETVNTTFNGKSVNVRVIGIGKYCFAVKGEISGAPKIPSSIEFIDEGAFLNINQYGTLNLENVKTIGNYAFLYSGLSELNLGNVEYIGDYAFYLPSNVHHIDLGEYCKYIGKYAFYDCSNLQELTVPDACEFIGDYAFYDCPQLCPLDLGKGVKHIGTLAFWNSHYGCSNKLELPASLEYIGPLAFAFNRTADSKDTDDDITDIYIHSFTPPEMPYEDVENLPRDGNFDRGKYSGFGDLREEYASNFWNKDGQWMYIYMCLHVPQGSRQAYESHPEWGKFSCIIDDLIPEVAEIDPDDDPDQLPQQSIKNIVGYLFVNLEPNVDNNEVYHIDTDVFPNSLDNLDLKEEIIKSIKWELYSKDSEAEIILEAVDAEGKPLATTNDYTHFIPKKIGEQLLIGYTDQINKTWDGDWINKKTVVGAVMVFVCPTVTLVFDNSDSEDLSRMRPLSTNNSDELTYDSAIEKYASVQHRSVYNSYPKFEIHSAAQYITFELEKAHFDENGKLTNDYEGLEKIDDVQKVGQGSETDGDYLVPLKSITENRLIKLNTVLSDFDSGMTTGVTDLQTNNFRIYSQGLTVFIEGADDDSITEIFDIKGSKLLSTKDKTFTLPHQGVYLLNLEDTIVKVIVR